MANTFLLLGSNQGDRQYFLDEALKQLSGQGTVILQSSVYETASWGLPDQPDFLNQVIQLQTHFTPEILLKNINKIEADLGRIRTIRYGIRNIDIDILYYDDLVLDLPDLIIPHPRLHLRRFTLLPLTEIAPHFFHPVLQKTNNLLLAECPDILEVKLYKKNMPS